MGKTISGGCFCGAIRYETEAEPVVMVKCHCRDCQRGSGYTPVMVVPKAAAKMSSEPRYYETIGESGMTVERGFCPNCGCRVAVKLERMPDVLGLQAASLNDPSQYKPGLELFTDSLQPWDVLHTATEKRPRGFSS